MSQADRHSYLNEITDILKQHWPENRTVNIVCHGHSVPAGYFATPMVDTFNAYPHLLHVGLKERFPFAVINVIVTAIISDILSWSNHPNRLGHELVARELLRWFPVGH